MLKKNLSNIKIVQSFFIMLILGGLSLVILSIISLRDMSKLDKNTETMYKDNLLPISQAGDIRHEMLNIRLNVIQALYSQDATTLAEYEGTVKDSDKKLRETLEKFKKNNLNSNEKSILIQFEGNYEEYIKYFDEIKVYALSNRAVTNAALNNYNIQADFLVSLLDKLVENNKQEASSIKEASSVIYLNTRNTQIAIITVLLLVFTLLALSSVRVIKSTLKHITADLDKISSGDFTVIMDVASKNEFGIMKKSISHTIESVSQMLHLIKASVSEIVAQADNLSSVSEEMAASSQESASSTQQISSGASAQASELETISDILLNFGKEIEGITHSIVDVDLNAKNINTMSVDNNSKLQVLINSIYSISNAFNDVSSKITSLGSNINKINEITGLINSIAEQTNLLALNAAIEAARAGDAGRGFAVVADEIRKLAEQSKTSSNNINLLLENILTESNSVVVTTDTVNTQLNSQISTINNSIESFKLINSAIGEILPKIQNINSSALNLNNNKDAIISKIEKASSVASETASTADAIAAASQQINASSEEVASTAQELNMMTRNIMNEMDKFKL
jgi:methyl-accepting chemotaxis protein